MHYLEHFSAATLIEQLISAAVIITITIVGPLTLAIACWRDGRSNR